MTVEVVATPALQFGLGDTCVYGSVAASGAQGTTASINQISASVRYHLSSRTTICLAGAFASFSDYGYMSNAKVQTVANPGLLHKF